MRNKITADINKNYYSLHNFISEIFSFFIAIEIQLYLLIPSKNENVFQVIKDELLHFN